MEIVKLEFGTRLISSIIIHMIRLLIFREKPLGGNASQFHSFPLKNFFLETINKWLETD